MERTLSYFIFFSAAAAAVCGGDDTVLKKCSELRRGQRYHIRTAETLGWSLDSCDQEWNLLNNTAMGYIQKNRTVLSPLMVSLTKQEAELKSCVNFTVTLYCDKVKVVSLTFLVSSPERPEDEPVLIPLGIAVAGCVTVLLLVLLLVIVLRCCRRRSPSSPPGPLMLV